MFLFLSKFLPIFVYPLSLAAILLALVFIFRKPKWRKRFLAAGVLLIWLGGNGWLTNALVKSLEWQYLPPDEIPHADAIVVLGGGTQPQQYPRPSAEVDGAGDRVIYGARLYREGKAPLVLVTGGRLPWSFVKKAAATEMKDLLSFLGVPEEVIILEEKSANTYENAVFTKEILEPMGINRILLVTSAMHMPRSVAIFKGQGFEVIPAPTDFNITEPDEKLPFSQVWPNYLFGLFPSAHNLSETTDALKEYLGILTYWARGWL
ncbi:MAG TPA: YdcF family protein [Anaerolineales bacterium]|nr:YdcF family protein [Anaerolineales bacterium]